MASIYRDIYDKKEIRSIRETDEKKIDTLSYLLATFITNINKD